MPSGSHWLPCLPLIQPYHLDLTKSAWVPLIHGKDSVVPSRGPQALALSWDMAWVQHVTPTLTWKNLFLVVASASQLLLVCSVCLSSASLFRIFAKCRLWTSNYILKPELDGSNPHFNPIHII